MSKTKKREKPAGETPVTSIRLLPQDSATLKALHRLGRLVPYLRRAAKTLPPSDGA